MNSHYARIRAAQPGAPVTAASVARSGAKMADPDRQLKLIGTGVRYVTVLLGANDVRTSSAATMTDPAVFRQQFQTAMTTFSSTHPDSYVLVSSIPNIRRLYELLKGSPTPTSTWRTVGICQSMLAATDTTVQRDAVSAGQAAFDRRCPRCARAWPAAGGTAERSSATPSARPTCRPWTTSTSVTGQRTLAALSSQVGYWGP